MFADLYRGDNPHVPEPFPPGTRVSVTPTGGSTTLLHGTVSTIPLKHDDGSTDTNTYMVILDDGSTVSTALSNLALVSAPPTSPDLANASLPSFLSHGNKVSLFHNDNYHRGFILHQPDGTFRFSCKPRINTKIEEWGLDLPNLPADWPSMCQNDTLLPSWVIHTAAKPISTGALASVSARLPSIEEPLCIGSVSHVSARNLQNPCPSSLLQALAPDNVDRDTWAASYNEEKDALKGANTFTVIDLAHYRELRKAGAPRAIPTMCVLVIKPNEKFEPDRAKSRVVVLGNLDDRPWCKHERAAPVMKYSSFRLTVSSAIAVKRRLKQGDFHNAFCNPHLPPEEITIVRPPLGDPTAKEGEYWLLNKTLYGLCRSPRHWYDMLVSLLLNMGLTQSRHDPCLFHGVPSTPEHPAMPGDPPITIGIYVDDFVYFSLSDAVEERFEKLLSKDLKVTFMGVATWFLGTHLTWLSQADGHISVHLSQEAFAQNLVERHRQHTINHNPQATPYRSGLPIDSIPDNAAETDENEPSFLRRRTQYQSVVGSLNWLATNTRPDLSPVVSFLASYNHKPTSSHMDSAYYAIKYLRSTASFGIAFHSNSDSISSGYIHFPFHHDMEAYKDAIPPTAAEHFQLTSYSDACWGTQFGTAIAPGQEVELFKYRSMSGFIVLRSGGPLAWGAVRQERTSRSSCEAEVRATDECIKEVLSIRTRAEDIGLLESQKATLVYNDNQGCVDWCKNTTTTGMKHLNLRENACRESFQAGDIDIRHIAGKLNVADIFTKELKDSAHFCRLRDAFMMDKSTFTRITSGAPLG